MKYKIFETKKYGVALSFEDEETADEFDDFINEERFVFSNIEFKADSVEFYFGQASCKQSVMILVEDFKKKRLT